MARAYCEVCDTEHTGSLVDVSDWTDRHQRKEQHYDIQIERAATDGGTSVVPGPAPTASRAPVADGGWPTGTPCPECGEPMDVGAVSTPGDSITWQQCDECGLGWGPFTGYVTLDSENDDTPAVTDGGVTICDACQTPITGAVYRDQRGEPIHPDCGGQLRTDGAGTDWTTEHHCDICNTGFDDLTDLVTHDCTPTRGGDA
ncbi:hypothetical protein [Haloarchaeobius sp. HRN-SO-5]|uniref:hypothetical protein n=1 Tax=Haloarchaeobius sp. HRN-SO-5 TaxID=3446118 RepID=UPI003EB8AF02